MDKEPVRQMTDEELENVAGGIYPYTMPFEMPDEPQLSKLKAAIRRKRCGRCPWVPITDAEVNTIIEQYVLPGMNGFPCPKCGNVIDATSFMYVICS